MKLLAIESARDPDAGPPRRDTRLRRIVRRTFYAKLGLAFCVLLLGLACYLRLVAGPVSLKDYSERVGEALAGRIGPGWHVELADTAIELQGAKPAVRTTGMEIRNPAGQLVVRAPYAVVSLDPTSLLVGVLSPREIELRDLQLLARVGADGSLAFVPPADPAASARPADAPAASVDRSSQSGEGSPSPVSRAVASLLEPVLGSASLIGVLDRARIVDARLTILGSDGRERAAFRRVNALFERVGDGVRRMSIDLDGPSGAWRIGGEVAEEGAGRRAELEASLVPLQDAMLLTGMSSFPALADLKLSGAISAALADGRLTKFAGRFESTPGSITPPGQKSIPVDRLAVNASWDEAGHMFDLAGLQLKSGGTEMRLAGSLTSGVQDGSWRLSLSGRDASWGGATPRDPAFKVDQLSAQVSFAETGAAIDRLTFKGQDVDIAVTGAMSPGPRRAVAARPDRLERNECQTTARVLARQREP